MMINNIPGTDFDKMVNLALGLLMDYGIYSFPIDLEELSKILNIKLIPYSELKIAILDELIEKAPDGFTLINKYNNEHREYLLFYNDLDCNEGRIRFTIAHEIGHILLGNVGKERMEDEEILCDYFAKCLLAPQCLIIYRKEYNVNLIIEGYNISKLAASNWLEAISSRIETFGEDFCMDSELQYLNEIKKYYNHEPASIGL